ncbi:MAG: hypothetical protein DMG02_03850 [Acidobacteria bacterium]|nr:MAG: hypothetical protein DMG02_03850 [Acidobacteriota bacterium]
MRKILVAAALVAFAAPAFGASLFDETEKISRTVAFEPGGTLRVKTFSGRVTITASDKNEVAVEAVRHASRDRLDRIKLDIHREGSTLVIDTNHREYSWWDGMRNNVVETDLDIAVPRRTNLDLNTFSAAITVDGVEGSSRVHGFSSRIQLNDIAGSVRAHTFSGPVDIRSKNWQDHQSITVDTFSGNIQLHVPENARGHVTFNSFSGRLNSEMPLTLHSSSRRNLSAELGGGADGSSLRFKTFSGSVRIDR